MSINESTRFPLLDLPGDILILICGRYLNNPAALFQTCKKLCILSTKQILWELQAKKRYNTFENVVGKLFGMNFVLIKDWKFFCKIKMLGVYSDWLRSVCPTTFAVTALGLWRRNGMFLVTSRKKGF
jgi:hypothetical protein